MCSVKKVFLEISQNSRENTSARVSFLIKLKASLCQSLFFNKVAGLWPASLFKKTLWHWCFPVNFVKILRTPFFIEHLWWLPVVNLGQKYGTPSKKSKLSSNFRIRNKYFRIYTLSLKVTQKLHRKFIIRQYLLS